MTQETQVTAPRVECAGGVIKTDAPRDFLTIGEVADIIGKSRKTIRDRLLRGTEGVHYRLATEGDASRPGATRRSSMIVPLSSASSILGTSVMLEDLAWDWLDAKWYHDTVEIADSGDSGDSHQLTQEQESPESSSVEAEFATFVQATSTNYKRIAEQLDSFREEVIAGSTQAAEAAERLKAVAFYMDALQNTIANLQKHTSWVVDEKIGG